MKPSDIELSQPNQSRSLASTIRWARHHGMRPYEYGERRQIEKWCGGHKAWHPHRDFGPNRQSPDGLAWQCREYRRGEPHKSQRSGSRQGDQKIVISMSGAKRLSARFAMSISEYLAKRQTEKWCAGHKAWQPHADFGALRGSVDGLGNVCREWDRLRFHARPTKRRTIDTSPSGQVSSP